jgi:hypothetical protein
MNEVSFVPVFLDVQLGVLRLGKLRVDSTAVDPRVVMMAVQRSASDVRNQQ